MLPEISLHILDIAQNSAEAGATRIEITVESVGSVLTVTVCDNGRGMSAQTLKTVIDPFVTTRLTRRVGMGVPFLKLAADLTGGSLTVTSEPGHGTTVTAVFHTDHIDCMPMGNLGATVQAIIDLYPSIDLIFTRSIDGSARTLDTARLKKALAPVPLIHPDVRKWLRKELETLT